MKYRSASCYFGASHRSQKDNHVSVGTTYSRSHLEAVHARHVDVEEDEIGMRLTA